MVVGPEAVRLFVVESVIVRFLDEVVESVGIALEREESGEESFADEVSVDESGTDEVSGIEELSVELDESSGVSSSLVLVIV